MNEKLLKATHDSKISENLLEATNWKKFRDQVGVFNDPALGQVRLFKQNYKSWLMEVAKSIAEPQKAFGQQLQETSAFAKSFKSLSQIGRITSPWSKLNSVVWGKSLSSMMGSVASPLKSLNPQSYHFVEPILPTNVTSFAKQWQKINLGAYVAGLHDIIKQYEYANIKSDLSSLRTSKKLKENFEDLRSKLPEGFYDSEPVSAKKFETFINDVETYSDDLSSITQGQFESACAAATAYLNSDSGAFDLQSKVAALSPSARFLINAIIQCVIIPVIIFYVIECYKDLLTQISSFNACNYASIQQSQGVNVPMAEISNPDGARVYPDSTDDVAPVHRFEHKQIVTLMWDRTKDGKWRRVAYAFDKDTNAPIKFGWIRTNTFERIRTPTKNIFGLYTERYNN